MDQLQNKRQHLLQGLAALGDLGSQSWNAEHVMTRNPICTLPTTTAYELVQIFHARQFRHLLVADVDHRLVGVVSDRDVLRCFRLGSAPEREELERICVAQLMSHDVITIEPQTPLAEAVTIMLTHGINCLPVVSDGKLAGILTSTDFYLVLEHLLSKGVGPAVAT
ncbi:MAG TPA: CBS domain-containing protein [Pirellulaceae bacterium]|nr:CBS domain-containing protein [Pirellulaceae bacterium]